MTFSTRLYTLLFGTCVGQDTSGNRYFRRRARATHGTDARKTEKRWVIYKGAAEPSSVPAEWHGWLHYTADAPPSERATRHAWQKPHAPNPTGTASRYLPSGHLARGGAHAPTAADYEPWVP